MVNFWAMDMTEIYGNYGGWIGSLGDDGEILTREWKYMMNLMNR